MKKIAAFRLLLLSLWLFFLCTNPAIGQTLSDAQKKERCQNNKNRITELETQLRVVNAEVSETMTQKEIQDVSGHLVFVRRFKTMLPERANVNQDTYRNDWKKINMISGQFNFSVSNCPNTVDECLNELQRIITKKIDKAKSLNKPKLFAKKNEIEKQLAFHKNNLIALGCNDVSANWNGTFVDAYGSVTISSSGTSMSASFTSQGPEDNWKNVGQWTNCKVEGNTAKCDWTCSYSDNNKTGTRKGKLEVTLSGNTISGSSFEDTPSFTWKPGITNKYTKMGKDAVWPINMKRK